MERVPIVRIRLPIVQHVMQRPEHHVVNVIRIISLKRLRNVQLARVRRIVKPVPKQLINALNVNQEIIRVEQDVNYAIPSQDVLNVHKLKPNVRNVIVDII